MPATKAWAFWSADQFTFSFDFDDSTPATADSTKIEKDVDHQDRVELFFWSGNKDDSYYCIEVASKGAIRDYNAMFYSKFDDSWSMKGFLVKTRSTKTGYTVKATITREDFSELRFSLARSQS